MVIVGDGPEREALLSLRTELELDGRVRLAGRVEDPSGLLLSADALVHSSRYESFPLAVLEAMHAGLPVVASDVGSIREAVVPGETGLLVPPEDVDALREAIRTVLVPDVGARLGHGGKEAAAPFTVSEMAKQYEVLYRTLLR